jgi:hypothetical protein
MSGSDCRPGEPAEIAAIADAVAGQEEAGVGGLRLRGRAGESRYGRNGKARRKDDSSKLFIEVLPVCFYGSFVINPPRQALFRAG